MTKYLCWVKFCIEVEADDEDGATDIAIEQVSDAIEVSGEIDVTSVEELEED